MSDKTIPEQIESLGRTYGYAQGSRAPRSWWLLQALYDAEGVRAAIEAEIRQMQKRGEMAKPPAGEGGREGEAL